MRGILWWSEDGSKTDASPSKSQVWQGVASGAELDCQTATPPPPPPVRGWGGGAGEAIAKLEGHSSGAKVGQNFSRPRKMTQGQAPLTDLIIHLIKLPSLSQFTRKDARQWMDKGISEDRLRWYLQVERQRRGCR